MKKILFLLAMLCAFWGVKAQTVVTMVDSMDRTGCDFVIYDCGGLHGDYTANRNDKLTIHSNNTAAAAKIQFFSLPCCASPFFVFLHPLWNIHD